MACQLRTYQGSQPGEQTTLAVPTKLARVPEHSRGLARPSTPPGTEKVMRLLLLLLLILLERWCQQQQQQQHSEWWQRRRRQFFRHCSGTHAYTVLHSE